MPRYIHANSHSHAIKFAFKGPTDRDGSHLLVTDLWHKTRKKLPLGGADAMTELFNYLEIEKSYTVVSHGYIDGGRGSDGIVMVKEFKAIGAK